jgi:hypothetical protein
MLVKMELMNSIKLICNQLIKTCIILGTNNELSEKEIKKTISFTFTKIIKYSGINQRNERLVLKNYETLMKESVNPFSVITDVSMCQSNT